LHFTLADLVTDITQNACEAQARLVELEISEGGGEFRFLVRDNGKGMTKEELEHALDPFVTDGVKHPGRRVGLGIPFLIQTALQSGGGWRISSAKAGGDVTVRSGGTAIDAANGGAGGNVGTLDAANASGTTVEAWFDLANVDTPPVGDIPGLFRTALLFTGPEEIVLRRSRTGGSGSKGTEELDYEIKKTELTEALGGDLEDVSSLVLLGKYLRSLEGEEES